MTALSDIITYFLVPFMVAMTFIFIEVLCVLFILDKLMHNLPDFVIRFVDAFMNVMLVLVFFMVQAIVLYGFAYVLSTV